MRHVRPVVRLLFACASSNDDVMQNRTSRQRLQRPNGVVGFFFRSFRLDRTDEKPTPRTKYMDIYIIAHSRFPSARLFSAYLLIALGFKRLV